MAVREEQLDHQAGPFLTLVTHRGPGLIVFQVSIALTKLRVLANEPAARLGPTQACP